MKLLVTSFKIPQVLRRKARRAAKERSQTFGAFIRQAVEEKIERVEAGLEAERH